MRQHFKVAYTQLGDGRQYITVTTVPVVPPRLGNRYQRRVWAAVDRRERRGKQKVVD